ncbi:La protein [Intoshia linei]|uniref:La protein n=1 Tax=Intoshia linei TaxID=1819745 RepID=A0A177BBZ2_9BILA|nr:La protein [Intoshia linei]
MTVDTKQIRKQVLFYFSDSNLLRDKFLRSSMDKDGWVKLDVLQTFKKLKEMKIENAVIGDVFKNDHFIEVSEDFIKIRRCISKAFPKDTADLQKQIDEKTVFISGFPIINLTLDNVEKYISKHGDVELIFLTRDMHRKLNGSAFVVFSKLEDVEKFVLVKDLKYLDSDISIKKMTQQEYFLDMIEKRKNEKDKLNKSKIDEQRECILKKYKKPNILVTLIGNNLKSVDLKILKEKLCQVCQVDWVDLNADKIVVRFREENDSDKFTSKVEENSDKMFEYNLDTKFTIGKLNTEDEEKYWENMVISKMNSSSNGKRKSKYKHRNTYSKKQKM